MIRFGALTAPDRTGVSWFVSLNTSAGRVGMKAKLETRLSIAVLVLFVLAISPSAARAGSTQKLDFAGSGGTVSYTEGVGNPFLAEGGISEVIKLPDGQKFTITDGAVSITTGGCDVGKSCYTRNGVDQLVLGFANSASNGITITGSVFGLPANTDLISGELINTGAVIRGPDASMKNCSSSKEKLGQCGPDTGGLNAEVVATYVNPTLLRDLGFVVDNGSNPAKSIEQMNFTLLASAIFGNQDNIGGIGNVHDSSIQLTDISITLSPEPTTLLLLGTSFLVGAGLLRRKLATRA
jgi:hypothetical protein